MDTKAVVVLKIMGVNVAECINSYEYDGKLVFLVYVLAKFVLHISSLNLHENGLHLPL